MTTVEDRHRTALHLKVTGLVQGVGFRPFVHRLAMRHHLGGWVRNSSSDVQIEIEGDSHDLEVFVREMREKAPPLARIEQVEAELHAPTGAGEFTILASAEEPEGRQPVSPDVALCGQCEAELFDPANRRYRYPFITCTDCGPRFTVIEDMPYDRARTSMRTFKQCPECLREYQSPESRRYHSETNSCTTCGPRLALAPGTRPVSPIDAADPLRAAARCLLEGAIVAVRGLGGFHLAVDATYEVAVERLRRRKHRDAKPLAVMVRTVDEARVLGEVSQAEARWLTGPERPIVVLRRRPGATIAPSVSPGLDTIGVMLAYTPLHHLLLDLVRRPLVMTSGNRSEEPIAIGNAQAQENLRWIADVFLLHDREIVSRYDDSVVRVAGEEAVFLRRARGYAPFPLPLPVFSPSPVLAVGAHLKNTFTLACEDRAYVSQHIGDLDDIDTLEHFLETLRLYRRLFRVTPAVAARDLHPDYLSGRIAEDLGVPRIIAVQHHHAHIAAVMAEHGITEPVVGAAYDGSGYGDDGNIWGSEIMVADLTGYRRLGHLRYAPLPGGDLGARQPWRSALGYLSLDRSATRAFRQAFEGIPAKELDIARHQIEHRLNAPPASSMGRLFDAAAAILGLRQLSDHEAQAAMELEALAGERVAAPLRFPLVRDGSGWLLDPLPLLVALGESLAHGADRGDLAAGFHESVATATAEVVSRICRSEEIEIVALGGGVFQNARLLSSVRRLMAERGLQVLTPRQLSPNDGAVSYGQAAVAVAQLRAETGD
ncbi:MAG: carbamoyltransferase HypF [Gemmatimonadetes bacterium]|nr:carbamoyltransferase HypF [Gemmatimonadota bacterium]